jgi:hypothetical protein
LPFAGVLAKDGRMGNVVRVPVGPAIIALAVAGELVGALTDMRLGAALATVVATAVTLLRMRAEVHALRGWDTASAGP